MIMLVLENRNIIISKKEQRKRPPGGLDWTGLVAYTSLFLSLNWNISLQMSDGRGAVCGVVSDPQEESLTTILRQYDIEW